MAELSPTSGKQRGKHSIKRMPVRVDLTAMVDLAFLLITFFMLTTSLQKPKSMQLNMPTGTPSAVRETGTMTICLGKHDKAMWYLGLPDKPLIGPVQVNYGKQLTRAIIETSKRVNQTSGKGMMVIVKPSEHSEYADLVETLDELNITRVPSYAIAKVSPKDIDYLKQDGIY